MKSLLLALALLLSPPAEAGKKKDARAAQAATDLENRAATLLGVDDAKAVAEARTLLDEAIATHPDPGGRVYAMRAMARTRLGDLDGGIADIETALDMPPGDSEGLVLDLAINLALQKSMGEDPGQTPATAAETDAALALLDRIEARIQAEHGGSAQARSLVARARIGALITSTGRAAEMLEVVRAARALEPEAAELAAMEASLHLDAGRIDQAVALATEVVAQAPDLAEARYVLAQAHVQQAAALAGQAAEAADGDEALALQEQAAAAWQQARPHLEVLHRADPDDPELLRQLMSAALAADDTAAFEQYKAKRDAL